MKYLIPTFILGIIIILAVIVSLKIYPDWRLNPYAIWVLLPIATMGVIVFLRGLLLYFKDYFELSGEKDRRDVSKGSDKTLSIEGDISQIGQTNIIAQELQAERIIGTQIDHAEYVTIHEITSPSKDRIDRFFLKPFPLPDYYVPRVTLLNRLRNLLGMGPIDFDSSRKSTISSIALVGLGGVGKTILAQALITEDDFSKSFPDGFLWARIGPDAQVEVDSIYSIINWFNSFGIEPKDFPDFDSKIDALRSAIGNKVVLIVLDDVWNSELLNPILKIRGPNCVILLITRDREIPNRLGIKHIVEVESLDETEAKQLVSNRLGIVPTDDEWKDQIHPVLSRLEWHPLAISLVSAQVSIGDLSWQDFSNAIENNEAISKIDFKDTKYREESLNLTFALSTRSLSEIELRQFSWLGVLAPGEIFSIEEAASLFPDLDESDLNEDKADQSNTSFGRELRGDKRKEVKGILNNFYRKGLIEIVRINDYQIGYRMHSLLHQHCLNILKDIDEYRAAIDSHAILFLHVITADSSVDGPKMRTHESRPQWTLALNRAWKSATQPEMLEVSKPDTYLYIIISPLCDFFNEQGLSSETILWTNRVLSLNVDYPDKELAVEHHLNLVNAYTSLGNYQSAEDHIELALEITGKEHENELLARCYFVLGNLLIAQTKTDDAIKYYEETIRIRKEINDKKGLGDALGNIGISYLQKGEIDKAIESLRDALDIARELKDLRGAGKRLGNLGSAQLEKGKTIINAASGLIWDSLMIAKQLNDPISEARQLMNLSLANSSIGKNQLATICAKEAKRILDSIRSPESSKAQLVIDRLEGKLPDPVEFIPPPEMLYLAELACKGDRLSEARLRPTLNVYRNLNQSQGICQFTNRLLLILDGVRDNSVLLNGLPEEYIFSIKMLLLKIEDPIKGSILDNLSMIIGGVVNDLPGSKERAIDLIQNIENSEDKPDFISNSLATSLRLVVSGERNPEIIIHDLEDDFISEMIREILIASRQRGSNNNSIANS